MEPLKIEKLTSEELANFKSPRFSQYDEVVNAVYELAIDEAIRVTIPSSVKCDTFRASLRARFIKSPNIGVKTFLIGNVLIIKRVL